MWGTPILHDDTQNFNGVLVFADQYFLNRVLDINMSWMFHFEYLQFNNWQRHFVIDIKFAKLK